LSSTELVLPIGGIVAILSSDLVLLLLPAEMTLQRVSIVAVGIVTSIERQTMTLKSSLIFHLLVALGLRLLL